MFIQMLKELKICHDLECKKRVLTHYTQTYPDIKEALNLMYDPLVKFNYKLYHSDFDMSWERIFNNDVYDHSKLIALLYSLSEKRITKRVDKEKAIFDYIHNKGEHLVLFLRKSLDMDIGLKTMQKLGIVDKYSVQKGVTIQLRDLEKLEYPLVADYKYNGARLSVEVYEDKTVICKLLKGRKVNIPLLEQKLQAKTPVGGYVLDGELVFNGGVTEKDRLVVNGLITSATSDNSPLLFKGLTYVVYDILPLTTFAKCEVCQFSYKTRRATLENVVDILNDDQIVRSQIWAVHSPAEVKGLLAHIDKEGGEGLMLKAYNSRYMHTKNNQWLKLKNMKEADLKIVAYKPHSRNEALIGSLLCEGTIDGKAVRAYVGSGLNDGDRPISKFNQYKGKIAMVTYLDVIESDKGGYSLSNPRFVKADDKTPLSTMLRDDIDATTSNF